MELPRYFINHTEHLPDVYIKKYESKTNATKEKISLTHHLISFVIEGKKELMRFTSFFESGLCDSDQVTLFRIAQPTLRILFFMLSW